MALNTMCVKQEIEDVCKAIEKCFWEEEVEIGEEEEEEEEEEEGRGRKDLSSGRRMID